MTKRALLVLSFLVGLLAVRGASAQELPSGAGRDDELSRLEKEIDDAAEELSTGGCAVACRALASMQRAADRLCALDPGPRCAAARAKVADATDRVRAACPECDVGASARPPAPAPATSPPEDEAKGPPPEAPKGGGCAGCTVAAEDDGGAGAIAGALLVGLAIVAGRRRRGRRQAR